MDGVVLVDSNIFIGLLRRGVDPSVCLGRWIGTGDLATCGIVRIEVERGLKSPSLRTRLSGFFDVMLFAATTNAVWQHATETACQLDRAGKNLPAQDLVIASCAHAMGAMVLTDDAHFDAIPGIIRLDPGRELPSW